MYYCANCNIAEPNYCCVGAVSERQQEQVEREEQGQVPRFVCDSIRFGGSPLLLCSAASSSSTSAEECRCAAVAGVLPEQAVPVWAILPRLPQCEEEATAAR
jgi:hypothetical protein